MKLHLIILMFLLNAFYLQSAELTIEGYGTDKMSPTYNYDKDKMFMVWTAKTQNFTNLGIRSIGSCGGTVEIINGVQNQNIMCESKMNMEISTLLPVRRFEILKQVFRNLSLPRALEFGLSLLELSVQEHIQVHKKVILCGRKMQGSDPVMENAKNRMMNFKKKKIEKFSEMRSDF